ncbi:hypothetical protein K1719_008964 [Acacia pycnantha]|nr:hypothetical protein K1719_008964 [Acacia pycnantha]
MVDCDHIVMLAALENYDSESFKKRSVMSASSIRRNSLSRKGRRSSKVMSVEIEDVHDAEELKAVEEFCQALIMDELLPAKHDVLCCSGFFLYLT